MESHQNVFDAVAGAAVGIVDVVNTGYAVAAVEGLPHGHEPQLRQLHDDDAASREVDLGNKVKLQHDEVTE